MAAARHTPEDPRVRVSADHLMQIGAQVRNLRFLPRQPARSILNGRHASRLRGRGLNFEELRGYLPGDDTRTIDWKVTARTGEPHVRVYTEERDRPALLLVDQRMSMFFGSTVYMKSVVAAEAAAIAAHRVLHQGDRVGGIVFADAAVSEHRPQRRPAALRRLVSSIGRANELLHAEHRPEQTVVIDDVLQSALRLAHTNALIMVFSDFDGLTDRSERLLSQMAHANDLILFNVHDPASRVVPEELRVTISDGDLQAALDASDPALRSNIAKAMEERLSKLHDWSRRYGFPLVPMSTDLPARDQLLSLFGHQTRRQR